MIAKRFNKRKDKTLSNRLYCTVDGVLTPVVYKALERSYIVYTDLFVTNETRIAQQNSLTKSTSISKKFEEIENNVVVDVKPVCVFDFHSNVQATNNSVDLWRSSFGLLNLNQSTSANQPILGEEGRGKNGFSPIRFSIETSSFMSLSSSATLSGDFTILLYVKIIGHPVNKYMRFLGKSDDNNMFFSAGDTQNKSYIMKFDSSNIVQFDSSTYYYKPTDNPLLITVRRKGNVLEIRENGVSIGSQTCPTTDFTFDQFGRTGNINLSFNGNLFHFSAYDGYLDNSIETVENAILKSVKQAKALK
jgi:hypothetical protein